MLCVMLVTLLPYVTLLPVWSLQYIIMFMIGIWMPRMPKQNPKY